MSTKIKLLKIMELLRGRSDEEHPIRATEICEKMLAEGIPCDRRTLTKDMKMLNAFGYEVMSKMAGHEKAYYVADRSFSDPEIKILMDAVQASSFITSKKTAELIDRIAALSGAHRADSLKKNMVFFNTRKHTNEEIYYNIDALEEAIDQGKKVAFLYFDIREHSRKVLRKNGAVYVTEPITLIFEDNNYYLISYSEESKDIRTYRVDRMKQTKVIDEEISETAREKRNTVGKYAEESFNMYGGEPFDITVVFGEELMGAVYDRFGESTRISPTADGKYSASVRVRKSPTFWGWLFQFGGKMKIISPQSMVDECRKEIEKLWDSV